jgi:hypothetical protein
MANVKLFGLVLIVTTSILALAAISTQTNQIRIRSFGGESTVQSFSNNGLDSPGNFQNPDPFLQPPQTQQSAQPQPFDPSFPNQPQPSNQVQFVSIPIVVPLCVAGLLGMMLWFTPMKTKPTKFSGHGTSRRRR